jgi:hypothetical protein
VFMKRNYKKIFDAPMFRIRYDLRVLYKLVIGEDMIERDLVTT